MALQRLQMIIQNILPTPDAARPSATHAGPNPSRRSGQLPASFRMACVSLTCLALVACGGSGLEVMRSQQQLKESINTTKALRGVECAPVELAKAEANLAFALVEMGEGDSPRARQHLSDGEAWLKAAQSRLKECPPEEAPAPAPSAPKDSDQDGIADTLDACPDRPEDLNGIEDDDGCPEGTRDRDGDGIVDNQDRCPDQPEDRDGVEDEDGCPDVTQDQDNDGIADEVDRCPAQPEDRDNFQDQDGCPDVDNDGDGLFDVVDKCPNEGEDIDGFEDSDGCPDLDNDRDTIVDVNDKCPTEPETFNTFDDEDGCPDTKPEAPQVKVTKVEISGSQIRIKEQIRFKLGSDVILPVSYPILDDVVKVLQSSPKMKLRIEGHTDDQGKELYNLNLSKRRATSVMTYLIKAGIGADRLRSVGLGEGQPLIEGITEEARAANRRVEFHITEQ